MSRNNHDDDPKAHYMKLVIDKVPSDVVRSECDESKQKPKAVARRVLGLQQHRHRSSSDPQQHYSKVFSVKEASSDISVAALQQRSRPRCNSEPARSVVDIKVIKVSTSLDNWKDEATPDLYLNNLALQREAYLLLQDSGVIIPKAEKIVSSIWLIERVRYAPRQVSTFNGYRDLKSYWHGELSLCHWIALHATDLKQLKEQFLQLVKFFSREMLQALLRCSAVYFDVNSHAITRILPLDCLAFNSNLTQEKQRQARQWVCERWGVGSWAVLSVQKQAVGEGTIKALRRQLELQPLVEAHEFAPDRISFV